MIRVPSDLVALSRFRFIHAADLHLDSPFVGVGQSNPQIREVLRDASLEARDRLVELTIEKDAALLLLAGSVTARRAGAYIQRAC
jgi:hypothetical protein